jgi:hypothetical protein
MQMNIHQKDLLQGHRYGYFQSQYVPGLRSHKTRPISFTLVVDDFGVKYGGKEHTLHLKLESQWIGTMQIAKSTCPAWLQGQSTQTIPTSQTVNPATLSIPMQRDQIRYQETICSPRI